MGHGSFRAWSRVAMMGLAAACCHAGVTADEGEAEGRRFELTVSSVLKVQSLGNGAVRQLDAWSQLQYELAHRAREMDVSIHSLDLRLKENGKESLNTRFSRAGIVTKRGNSTEELDYEDQAPRIQQRLQCFDRTAVTVELDAAGNELKRTTDIEGALAEPINGLLESLLSVHARFPNDANRWDVPARLAMGEGRFAKGTLRFEKLVREGNTVRVRVAGRLVPQGGAAKPGESRTGTHSVTGEQIYDLTSREWRSADWSIELALDIFQNGKPAGAVNGTMKLTVRPAIHEPKEQ